MGYVLEKLEKLENKVNNRVFSFFLDKVVIGLVNLIVWGITYELSILTTHFWSINNYSFAIIIGIATFCFGIFTLIVSYSSIKVMIIDKL